MHTQASDALSVPVELQGSAAKLVLQSYTVPACTPPTSSLHPFPNCILTELCAVAVVLSTWTPVNIAGGFV